MTSTTEPAPLSQIRLFPQLREFYSASGVQAWAGTVPLHPTCNPHLADAYATVIIRFIQEALVTGRADPGHPFYVAELGAGTGKFGFHLVRRVRQLRQALGLENLKIVHVMSDVVDSNIDHWRCHPGLRPFAERGEVVFARFDVETDRAFHLVAPGAADGTDGAPGTRELAAFTNPLIVIANYVFDSLPQDLFRLSAGGLEEMLATVLAGDAKFAVRLNWSSRSVVFPHYHEPELDALLAEARPQPETNAMMFPLVALRALRRLADAAKGRLVLLASDLGIGRGLISEPQFHMKAGSDFFYLPVDLSAIGAFFGRLGPGIHRHRPAIYLDTSLSISGFEPSELRATCHAFSSSAEAFGARGRAAISALLEHGGADLEPEEWLAISALLRYDSELLDASMNLIPRWIQADALHPQLKREVLAALRLFGAEIYWTPGASDTYFNLATLLYQLGATKAAVAAYVLSIETVGPAVETFVSMAMALRALDRVPEALESLRDALAMDPGHIVARGWLGRIELELAGQLPAPAKPQAAEVE